MAILTPYYSSQFLRFLRKFSIRFLHPQVLLLRLLGVEVVFLPPALCFLSSSASKVLGFGLWLRYAVNSIVTYEFSRFASATTDDRPIPVMASILPACNQKFAWLRPPWPRNA